MSLFRRRKSDGKIGVEIDVRIQKILSEYAQLLFDLGKEAAELGRTITKQEFSTEASDQLVASQANLVFAMKFLEDGREMILEMTKHDSQRELMEAFFELGDLSMEEFYNRKAEFAIERPDDEEMSR